MRILTSRIARTDYALRTTRDGSSPLGSLRRPAKLTNDGSGATRSSGLPDRRIRKRASQVSGRSDLTSEPGARNVEHRGLRQDLKILLHAVGIVQGRTGAC